MLELAIQLTHLTQHYRAYICTISPVKSASPGIWLKARLSTVENRPMHSLKTSLTISPVKRASRKRLTNTISLKPISWEFRPLGESLYTGRLTGLMSSKLVLDSFRVADKPRGDEPQALRLFVSKRRMSLAFRWVMSKSTPNLLFEIYSSKKSWIRLTKRLPSSLIR
jgi:hypothetical protein